MMARFVDTAGNILWTAPATVAARKASEPPRR